MQALTVPGNLDSLDDVGRYVLEAAAAAGLDKKAAYRLRLAVDEIVTNIIVHGYEEAGRSGDVYLQIDLDGQALTLTVTDMAVPFDPRSLPAPNNLDDPLEMRKIGGLGVYLAINGVDRFDYHYTDAQNHNIFTMYRPSSQT